jgi:CheY-like chemotaxis protein
LKTELTEKQKEYLDAIKISGDALIVLINDILDLAKVDAGKMTFEQKPFKLSDSVSSMIHLFDAKAKEKGIELEKEYDRSIPATIIGDPVRLQQVVLNLLSNAVKFTNKGKITLGVKMLRDEEEKIILEFSVLDTGIGIPENKLESIFENFQQATNETSRLYGGTGLGLAIVKKLVEAQHGKVWVKSRLDEGSGFYFTLGFRKVKEEEKKKERREEGKKVNKKETKKVGNAKILVVEDVTLNQLLMKTLLEGFGFTADIAGNGKIAIEKMQKNEYDLILMDLQMPEMNGFETTGYIRSKMNSDVPIIALTADVTTVDVEKCRAVGMDDYLAKPINEKLLYSKMMKYLKEEEPEQSGDEQEVVHTINESVTSLEALRQYTKGNEETLREMISIYLEETPRLVNTMKQSIDGMDWEALALAAHALIPSFTVMGMNKEYEDMTKKIQEHAKKKEKAEEISDLVNEIERVCKKACVELEEYLQHTNLKTP